MDLTKVMADWNLKTIFYTSHPPLKVFNHYISSFVKVLILSKINFS